MFHANSDGSVIRTKPDGPPCTRVGAQLIVRVEARAIFPNCPRYISAMQMVSPSIYTPQPKCEPPEPAWKSFDAFKDVMHPRQPTWKG
jgi:hypothetical protein